MLLPAAPVKADSHIERHPVHPGGKFIIRVKAVTRAPELVDHFLGKILPVFLIAAIGIADLDDDPLVLLY